MQLTTSSTLALFETTKDQRAVFIDNIIAEIKEGNVDVLKVHMQLKCTEQLLDTLNGNPDYRKILLDAANLHGKKFETYNAEFQVKEAGTKWDYSNTGDLLLIGLQEEYDKLGARIKARQKLLQTLPASGMADPETGAMIYPATKTSTTIVACQLK